MAGWWRGAVAGMVAAGAALGVAEVVAVPIGPRSGPLIAVGGVVVDHVPEPVKAAAITAFGVHDKTALLVGTLVLLALAAAGIGVLALRSLTYAVAGVAGFAAAGSLAAVTRPGARRSSSGAARVYTQVTSSPASSTRRRRSSAA